MRLIVGTRVGSIKVVSVEEKKVVFATKPLLATGVDIEYMIWGPSGEPQAVIAHAGRIFTFDVNTGAIQSIVGGYTGKAASICLIPNEHDQVLVCNDKGITQIFSLANAFPYSATPGPVPENAVVPAIKKGAQAQPPYPKACSTFKVREPVQRARVGLWPQRPVPGKKIKKTTTEEPAGTAPAAAAATAVLAVGGEKADLTVWDISTKQQIWRARNVRAVNLLEPPIWVADFQFMPSEPQHVVVGTSYQQLRFYKTESTRDTQFNKVVTQYAICSLAVLPSDESVFLGTTRGEFLRLDASTGQLFGAYHGVAGSVRAIACHPNTEKNPFVACCGLDRFLHVYDIFTRKSIAKCSSLLFCAEPLKKAEEKRSADEVWASLDQAAEELLPPDRPVPEEPEGDDNENEESSSNSEHSEDEELSASQRKRTGRPVIRKAPAAKRRKTSKK